MPSSLAYVLSLIPFSPSSVYLTSLLSRSPLFLSLSTLLLFIFPFISCPIYSPPLFLSLYTLLLFIFPFISCPIYSPPLHLPLSFFRDITSLLSLSIFFISCNQRFLVILYLYFLSSLHYYTLPFIWEIHAVDCKRNFITVTFSRKLPMLISKRNFLTWLGKFPP